MEPEIRFEPFTQAERVPSPLPWAVYDAVDSRSGHGVRLSVLWALEHIPAERMGAALDWFAEAGYQAQRLTSPCLPAVLSYRSTPEAAYVATDRPGGHTLRERIEQGGPLPIANAMHISSLIAGVLAGVHAGGWPHGWLNPDTVWIQDDRAVSVTDLGLGLAAQSIAPGSPIPFPARPGFFSADPLRRDLQCLGLLLTLMVSGRLPDPVGVPRADIYPDDLPGGVVHRIRSLINPQVENPMSAAQWAEFARVGGSPAEPETDAQPDADYYEQRPTGHRRSTGWFSGTRIAWGLGGLAIIAAAVVAGNAWFAGRSEAPTVVPPSAARSTANPPPAAAPDALTKVQVGPVEPAQVEPTAARLRGMGFDPYIRREGGKVYFQVGAFANAESAETTTNQLKRANLPVRIQ